MINRRPGAKAPGAPRFKAEYALGDIVWDIREQQWVKITTVIDSSPWNPYMVTADLNTGRHAYSTDYYRVVEAGLSWNQV